MFIGYLGGFFWKNKDIGVWSILKGEYFFDENFFDVVLCEFYEEIGLIVEGEFIEMMLV